MSLRRSLLPTDVWVRPPRHYEPGALPAFRFLKCCDCSAELLEATPSTDVCAMKVNEVEREEHTGGVAGEQSEPNVVIGARNQLSTRLATASADVGVPTGCTPQLGCEATEWVALQAECMHRRIAELEEWIVPVRDEWRKQHSLVASAHRKAAQRALHSRYKHSHQRGPNFWRTPCSSKYDERWPSALSAARSAAEGPVGAV